MPAAIGSFSHSHSTSHTAFGPIWWSSIQSMS